MTFLVDDVRAVHDRLHERGFGPFGLDESAFQCFIHPRAANGALLQFMARHDEDAVPMSLEDVLTGRGYQGTGLLSP